MPEIKNVVPMAPQKQPEAPPKPVKIAKDDSTRSKRKVNPLRIDLASGGGGGSRGTGVNI